VRVRRRAGADDDQVSVAGVAQPVDLAGRDHCAVAGLDLPLLVADAEAQEDLVDRLLDRLPVDRSG
jgi:hypothetical protein